MCFNVEMSKYKKLRVFNNLTQSELAEKLGISQTLWSLIETQEREPSDNVKQKINDVFHISIKFME